MNIHKNKTALVTASSGGIGFEIAKKLILEGCKVIINGRNKKKLLQAKKKLKNVEVFCGDLSREKQIKRVINYIKKKHKKLDYLICNLGDSKKKSSNNFDIKEWKKFFDLNFWSTINIIFESQKLLESSNGKILCISSICGKEYIQGAPVAYSVAKSSINNFVKFQSEILAKSSIRINAIAPGNILFKGSIWEKKIKKNKKSVKSFIDRNVPLKTFGTAQDIANMSSYLLSDKSKFITGSVFVVDGGQTKSI